MRDALSSSEYTQDMQAIIIPLRAFRRVWG